MRIRTRRGWELPESAVTPESVVLGRRATLAGAGAIGLTAAVPRPARAQWAGLMRNPRYVAGRELTAEKDATTYNNYYEFSEGKNLWRDAQKLPQDPWSIRIEGMVSKPRTLDLDMLLKTIAQEERVYRHRCVEAWAMTVPWAGFPLSELLRMAEPLGSAKYVVFETVEDQKVMTGLGGFYPFPYIEACTIEEAGNELSFLTTGLFGKKVPPQNGGPIRLTMPWKYGFKQAKAIVKVTFTDKRPKTFWETINPNEYGFWANVNPAVAHPRWSQARERLLTTGETVPTVIYNGYGEFVAGLYADKASEKLFM